MNITENYLGNIFEEFKEKIVHVNFTQSFTKLVSETALRNLNKEYEAARGQDRESSITHMTNMICKDILQNQEIVIGFKDVSYAERIQILRLQHNRQYQWLLVEAYEAFEDFLVKLYAYGGYLDSEFWGKEDFEGISTEDIKKQKLDWFIKKAKRKKRLPESILRRVNEKIPSLARILASRKKGDPLNIDYEFTIILISKLRHKIVHAHGCANKEEFTNSRLAEFPLANKHNDEKQDYIEVIHSLFGNGQLENLITLLEVPNPTIKLPMMFVDRLGDLLARVTSYAMLLHNLTRSHFAEKQGRVHSMHQ